MTDAQVVELFAAARQDMLAGWWDAATAKLERLAREHPTVPPSLALVSQGTPPAGRSFAAAQERTAPPLAGPAAAGLDSETVLAGASTLLWLLLIMLAAVGSSMLLAEFSTWLALHPLEIQVTW
jgi:hypothetical protein